MSLIQQRTPQIQLLALHGFTGCGHDFSGFQADSLAQWHCPDLPGHLSQGHCQDCSPQGTLNALLETARQLSSPRILLGYSMGARAALQLMAHQADSWNGLILISGNPGISDPTDRARRRQEDLQLALRIEKMSLRAFLAEWQAKPIIQSQKNIPECIRKPMQSNRLQHRTQGLARSLQQFGVAACPDFWPIIPTIHCPILCITGSHDPHYVKIAHKIGQLNSQAQIRVIANVGHAPHLEAFDRCKILIENFLQKIRVS